MTNKEIAEIMDIPRFNPCFGGSYIVTISDKTKEFVEEKFQSLFWWILYCDIQ